MLRIIALLLLLIGVGPANLLADEYAAQRQKMLHTIEQHADSASLYFGAEPMDRQVLEVMGRIPRHEFVPKEVQPIAYRDGAVPIGYSQTISQPYIVALMSSLMQPKATDRVLEVGTGSGYQAAVLAELVERVFSIEIIEELGVQAAERLHRLGYDNVITRVGDGYYGWQPQAPFDIIVVTAASRHIPPPLIEQLKLGGRMVIPVGSQFQVQQLLLVEKSAEGKITTHQILPVRFVPLTGDH